MTKQEKLLSKYYKGETSLQEEKELKLLFGEEENHSPEQDIFGYFEIKSVIPNNLEETIFENLKTTEKRKKTFKMRLYGLSSAAAIIAVLLTVFINNQNSKNAKIENNFLVMEQALFQISKSIQPDVQEDMLVLWVDDDVEIIIN